MMCVMETNTKFTKGPWTEHDVYAKSSTRTRIVTSESGVRWLSMATRISHGRKIICEVTARKAIDAVDFGFPTVENSEEFEANVRLIAAAPDLYEALKWAMTQIGYSKRIKGQNDFFVIK